MKEKDKVSYVFGMNCTAFGSKAFGHGIGYFVIQDMKKPAKKVVNRNLDKESPACALWFLNVKSLRKVIKGLEKLERDMQKKLAKVKK